MRSLSAIALALIACGTAPDGAVTDDFSTLAGLDEKADLFSASMKVLGTLSYGQTSAQAVSYVNPPKYRAYKMTAHSGDYVDVWVRAIQGTPVAWLLDSRFNVVAQANVAPAASSDFHLVTNVRSAGTYYIAFREKSLASGKFSVELKGGTDYYACKTDNDCVAIDRGGCCPNGWKEAVNANQVKAYQKATACPNPRPICPLYVINDTRQPECNNGTHKCEMVAIENVSCGGFVMNSHHCPTGYQCHFKGVPDVPGTCQPLQH